MGMPPFRLSGKLAAAALGVWISIMVLYQSRSFLDRGIDHRGFRASDTTYETTVSQLPRVQKVILFPRNFSLNDRQQMAEYYGELSGRSLPDELETFFIGKYFPDQSDESKVTVFAEKSLPLTTSILRDTYQPHRFKLFSPADTSSEGDNKCESTRSEFTIHANEHREVNVPLSEIVANFYLSPFYEEHAQVFAEHPIQEQLESKTVHDYWFRFGGSSVYLEQYGIHYMVSRLVYSSRRDRSNGEISLLLGEVYDRQWQHIPNVEMIVPTNDPDQEETEDDSRDENYTVYAASSIIPIPIFHKMGTVRGHYYGAEDPRLILVKNSRGHEEPVTIFNQNHRILENIEEDNLDRPKVELKQYRSMFQTLIWQSQRGKHQIDGLPEDDLIERVKEPQVSKEKLYSKTTELLIVKNKRPKTQKNWTPFTSESERQIYGYDKYMYYVYRWSDLEILRCSLSELSSGTSSCVFVYRTIETKSISDGPGPFRGGTALISMNQLLAENARKHAKIAQVYRDLESSGREVWVGVARAHLNDCGCGRGSFYRPNLALITRTQDDKYSVSHVGLYTSFGIPVSGWDIHKPRERCLGWSTVSVLIPNLIAQWSVLESSDDNAEVVDYATLTLSIADADNVIIHVKGLLNEIMLMDTTQNDHPPLSVKNEIKVPHDRRNNNIECALQESKRFCSAFGEADKKAKEEREKAKANKKQ